MSGSPEITKNVSQNYFERVNADFEKALLRGEVQKNTLKDIAEKNKEDFFSLVKDVFSSPIEALKWFGTKMFGETFVKWNKEIQNTYKGVKRSAESVTKTAETSYANVKQILNDIPANIKNTAVIGGIYEAGEAVYKFLKNNPEEARKMPQDKEKQLKWWREIFISAGVNPTSVEGKGFLSLVTDKKTWTEISENIEEVVTKEKGFKKLKEDIANGNFDKQQLFKGEKIGEAGEKLKKRLDDLRSDVILLIQNNPNLSSIISAYLGYNIGLKRNGFKLIGDFGKIILKLASSPILIAKNNKLKLVLILLGGMLVKDKTKWDDYTIEKVKNTRLPKDFEEFKNVVNNNSAFKDFKKGIGRSSKEFNDAIGIIKDPKLIDKNFDEITAMLTPEKIALGVVDFVGQSPLEMQKGVNRTGFFNLQTYFSNNNNLKRVLGDDKYKALNLDFQNLGNEYILSGKYPLNQINFQSLEKLNEKYGKLASFRFEKYGDYVRYVEIDIKNGGIISRSINLGVRKDIDDDKKVKASRRFRINDKYTFNFFRRAHKIGSAGESMIRMYREMFGSLTDTLKITNSVEDINKSVAENIKDGKFPMVSDGDNFFIEYGGQFITLPYNVGGDILKYLREDKNVSAQDVAMSWGDGLAVYTVFGTTKWVGTKFSDVIYKSLTGLDRRIKPTGKSRMGTTALRIFKGAIYPVSMVTDAITGGYRFGMNIKEGGLKGIMKGSGGAEIVQTIANYRNGARELMGKNINNSPMLTSGYRKFLEKSINLNGELTKIGNARLHLLRHLRIEGAGGISDKQVINTLFGMFDQIEGGESIWKKIVGSKSPSSLSRDKLNLLLSETDQMQSVYKEVIKSNQLSRATAKEAARGPLSRYLVEAGKYSKDGLRSLAGRGIKGAASMSGKLMKSKKTYLVAGGALAAYAANEYFDEKYNKTKKEVISPNLNKESKEQKHQHVELMAKAIVGMQGEFMKKYLNDENLKRIAKLPPKEMDQEINIIVNWYEKAHNDLMNEIWVNYGSYKGNIEGIKNSIDTEMKKHNIKGGIRLEDTSKWYQSEEKKGIRFLNGAITISQNKDGAIELGWSSRGNMKAKLTRLAWEKQEGLLGLAKDMTPFLSTDRSFERAGHFYVNKNYEEMVRESADGVSNFAIDVLGVLSLGGVKAVQGVIKGKKATKLMESTADINNLRQRAGRFGKLKSEMAVNGAIGAAGLKVGSVLFKDEIDTLITIKR